jgi:hypothetical protein
MSTKVVRGIPTKLDVDKLLETFTQPKENDVIMWSEIEEATGLKKGQYRFNTVVNAWRTALERDFDILLYAIPGEGLAVADANTKIDLASRKIELNDKGKKKWVERTFRVKASNLDEVRRDTQSRILTAYGAMLKLTAATAPKRLPIPGC